MFNNNTSIIYRIIKNHTETKCRDEKYNMNGARNLNFFLQKAFTMTKVLVPSPFSNSLICVIKVIKLCGARD